MAYTKKNPMLNKGDAVYGEHFNNSALLAGMFSMIGQVNIPSQFESGLFNTTETPEKALFLRVTLEKLTGTNNGNNIILNTGQSFTLNTKVILSLFKSWKRFNLTGTNVDVEIGLYDENNNLIRNIINNQELTNFNITNESIKVVVTANSSCTISNVLFEVTTRKWDNNSSVTIPQEQITGLKEWEETKNQEINNINSSKVPITRKINNKTLDNDITLDSNDVGAQPTITTESKTVTLKSAGDSSGAGLTITNNVVTDAYAWFNLGYYENYSMYGIVTPKSVTPPAFSKQPIAIKNISFSGSNVSGNWARVAHVRYGYNSICISVRVDITKSVAGFQAFINNTLTMTIECYVI